MIGSCEMGVELGMSKRTPRELIKQRYTGAKEQQPIIRYTVYHRGQIYPETR